MSTCSQVPGFDVLGLGSFPMIYEHDMLGCSEDAAVRHHSGGTDCSQHRQVESAQAQYHPSDRLELACDWLFCKCHTVKLRTSQYPH